MLMEIISMNGILNTYIHRFFQVLKATKALLYHFSCLASRRPSQVSTPWSTRITNVFTAIGSMFIVYFNQRKRQHLSYLYWVLCKISVFFLS